MKLNEKLVQNLKTGTWRKKLQKKREFCFQNKLKKQKNETYI